MKKCYKCKQEKSEDCFHRNRATSDGLAGECKDCSRKKTREQQSKYRERNKTLDPYASLSFKICSLCSIEKPKFDFYRNRSSWDGLSGRCKDCDKLNYKKIKASGYKNGLDYSSPARRSHLNRSYGMSLEEYQERCEKQNHLCAICNKPETAVKRGQRCNLCVDHDHKTGKNRDLLCDVCNRVLGGANDSIEILEAAIQYLRRHSDGRDPGNAWANNGTYSARGGKVAG